jgi:hypothetical protein
VSRDAATEPPDDPHRSDRRGSHPERTRMTNEAEIEIEIDVDDGAAFVSACSPLVAALGGGFMISSPAKAFSQAHGLSGRQAYVLGRGSVLGDVDADVVTAGFGFWPADVVREAWDGGRAVLDVATARTAYAEVCRDWGRARLASMDGVGRLAELLSWVVDGVDVAGLPLFAGWRAVELPADDAARATQLLHVLREYRGGVHLVAVLASGLTPLQAVLAGPGGSANATFFGWEEPLENVGGLAEARAASEELTDALVAPAYDVLGHDERHELLTLLTTATATAFSR